MLYSLHELADWLAFLRHAEFRALFAAATAFLIAIAFGRWFIGFLANRHVLERTEKGDSAELKALHEHKRKTPTMGGVIVLLAVLASTLLWARLDNRLVFVVLGLTLAFGALGFVDDYVKLRTSRKGISARTKFLWQALLSGAVGVLLYNDPLEVEMPLVGANGGTALFLPFVDHVWVPLGVAWIALVVIVTTGASNAVNLTDGLDGLAIGCSILVAVTFVAVALLAGHASSSAILGIPHVVGSLEVAVFAAAMAGAGLGFLWFNCHPAQIFMGDTGALALGGALGLVAIVCKQEILLFLAGGVLVAEALSVMLQVTSFKLTGKRIFLCAPLHHHFEFKGWAETKVTVRFWIATAVLSFGTLLALRL